MLKFYAVLITCLFTVEAMADDNSVPPAQWTDVLVILLKQVLPILGAFLSGYVTKGMLWLMSAAGATWSPILTTIIGMVTSGISAAFLGQSPDMIGATATVGAGAGAASHALLQSKPLATVPKEQSSGALNGEHL